MRHRLRRFRLPILALASLLALAVVPAAQASTSALDLHGAVMEAPLPAQLTVSTAELPGELGTATQVRALDGRVLHVAPMALDVVPAQLEIGDIGTTIGGAVGAYQSGGWKGLLTYVPLWGLLLVGVFALVRWRNSRLAQDIYDAAHQLFWMVEEAGRTAGLKGPQKTAEAVARAPALLKAAGIRPTEQRVEQVVELTRGVNARLKTAEKAAAGPVALDPSQASRG